ncbi:mitoguardin isoform X2 [Daktulosphaira vitifoliae]|uniref:mitoguardin isoform X2 n=1 Tax=Daktulosphaira vitifoliae TaxID=58002 RepID=UPI0021AA4BF7|nr:mitoguardin isoform X2 [Daktulosphaira vitifoliae]
MCGKKSALVLYSVTKLTSLVKKYVSEHLFQVSVSLSVAVSTTIILVFGNFWKRKKFPKQSAPVIKHLIYERQKPNVDIIPSVSSFRIFRTSHRSLSPSIKSNRQASVISSVQDSPNNKSDVKYTAPQQLGVMGMESLACSISFWEDALSAFTTGNSTNKLMSTEDAQFCKELQLLVDSAYSLQDQCQLLFLDQRSVLFRVHRNGDVDLLQNYNERRSSVDSFVSARTDVANLKEFEELNFDNYYLYQIALRFAENNTIPCRTYRTTLVNCVSDKEYVCKLYCIRLAFENLFKTDFSSIWFADCGRRILTDIFLFAEKDPKDFLLAFEEMLCWAKTESHWKDAEAELSSRGVKKMTFYDIVMDYILMDAFEDLESPPASVIAVIQNRWLSKGFKETALSTAVWSVLRAKRSKLKYPNGFMHHFYNISEQMSPLLAWGFLGPDEELTRICLYFKDQVIELMRDMFNFEKCRYTTKEELAHDLFDQFKIRAENISKMIEVVMHLVKN